NVLFQVACAGEDDAQIRHAAADPADHVKKDVRLLLFGKAKDATDHTICVIESERRPSLPARFGGRHREVAQVDAVEHDMEALHRNADPFGVAGSAVVTVGDKMHTP